MLHPWPNSWQKVIKKQAAAQYQIDMTQNTIAGIEAEIGTNEEMSRTGAIDKINSEIAVLEANIAKTQEELNIAEAKRKEQKKPWTNVRNYVHVRKW